LAESKKLYEAHCSFCHGAGPARGGTAALERRLGKDRALLENRQDLDRTYVQYVVRNGLNAMIPFRRTEINDQELSFILDWLGRPHMAAAPAATTAPTGTQP
jgi:mono/diheme cytochrome c family protein